MTPIFYVDLSLGTDGHTGVLSDPFSWNDFISNILSSTEDTFYYIKGFKEFSSDVDIILGKNLVMNSFLPWDISINGPWRIKIDQGVTGSLTIIGIVENSIISCPVGPDFTLNLNGCYFITTDVFLPNTVVVEDNTDGFGSNFISNHQTVDSGNIQVSDGIACYFYDCVLDTKFEKNGVGTSIVSVVNCATTENDYISLKSTLGTLLVAKTQYGWSAPTWPSWDSPQEEWSSNILSVGITTPPEPGSYPYYVYNTGLYGESRTGIGAFFFEAPLPVSLPNIYTNSITVSVIDPEIKVSGMMTCLGWVRSITVADGDVIIPLAVADTYGNVVGTDAAIRIEILREGMDYRLQYSGSKSKLIDKTLKIKINDGSWHFIGYECDAIGNMKFYVDSILLSSEDGLDSYGLPFSVAKSFSSRVGGGSVWTPYLYNRGQVIYQYNWRFGKDFNLGLVWIQKLMDKDKQVLKIV